MAAIELPPLPWPTNALEPAISRDTIETHYGKHHRAYVEKTNTLAGSTEESLEDIVLRAAKDPNARTLFNNAAQAWNHNRYWESLSPNGRSPKGALAERIDRDLGGLVKLKDEIVAKGVGHFASGWVWLVFDKGKLAVLDTHDADNALARGVSDLLTIHLWEHAYYLDYKQEREKHLRAIVENVLNWDAAGERFDRLSR